MGFCLGLFAKKDYVVGGCFVVSEAAAVRGGGDRWRRASAKRRALNLDASVRPSQNYCQSSLRPASSDMRM